MKRFFPAWSGYAMALLVPMWLLSVSASAQSHGSSGGSSSSSGTATSSGGGGGGSSSGGSSSTGTSHASSGGGTSSGTATARDSGGGGGVSSGGSVGSTRGGSDGSLISGSSSGARSRGEYRADPITRGAGDPVPTYARPSNGRPTGTAIARTGPVPGPGQIGGGGYYYSPPYGYYGGYYPYGFAGLGFGSYYGSYGYDPWFDPFYGGFGGGYAGYGYGGGGGDPQYSSSSPGEEGSLRLKIKPREASVFVDGYYVGLVDEFDGLFQKMHVEAGPHRIEVRMAGYETLAFEVRLVPDHTTTYTGDLKKIQ